MKVELKWVLEMEQRVTRLEEQDKWLVTRITQLDNAVNTHRHDKSKETPTFEAV